MSEFNVENPLFIPMCWAGFMASESIFEIFCNMKNPIGERKAPKSLMEKRSLESGHSAGFLYPVPPVWAGISEHFSGRRPDGVIAGLGCGGLEQYRN